MTDRTSCLLARLLMLALIVAIALPVAACGRKASPDRPEDSKYPHSYPSQ